jgi:diketogulonate reductase-like aldo/keto reductase
VFFLCRNFAILRQKIFISGLNWWYDIPQVRYSFFDEYDFSGKTIIPFCTHNGSRFSGTIETIQGLEPDEAESAVLSALTGSYRLIDTANVYVNDVICCEL